MTVPLRVLLSSLLLAAAAPTPARSQPDMPQHTNRLAGETSPYLLQHAHNPVDWNPWGPEAFETARRQDKPIFLSIGYSTCYWCHVMERESFEDEQVAAILNEHYVAIKVDREERPDVDDVYMAAVQALTGGGGWPMSVWLEPVELKPFFGGTYFPREQFTALLERIDEVWRQRRGDVEADAGRLADAVSRQLESAAAPVPIGAQQVTAAQAGLMRIYDPTDGGFGGGGPRANKFPMPVYLELLMAIGWESAPVRAAVLHTLDRMATGGMYDQIGGGFHRYSTDPRWLVPHFEKMLYDNGQLASVYAGAHARTGDPFYAEIVRETLDYVLCEMTGDGGAFYSAQDAEVNAREGGNYVWTGAEVTEALSEAGLDGESDLVVKVYGFDGGTNFRDPHHPEDGAKNVVHLAARPEALAEALGVPVADLNKRLVRANAALYEVRQRRDQPATDDKILAGWNGLMIAGMADGGRVLAEPRYVEAARRAAGFVLTEMRAADGGLMRSYRAGEAKIAAFLEDYALVIRGLVALHRATGEDRWLDEARALEAVATDRFRDDSSGAYFDTLPGQDDLFVRTTTTYDGAVPCGNSVMAGNLLDLHELTGDDAYLRRAGELLAALSPHIARSPVSTALATAALRRFLEEHPLRAAAALGAEPPAPQAAGPVTVELNDSGGVTLTIADGYHVNAHEPGQAGLIGVSVELVDGEGLAARVEYPPGERYRDEIRVHRGSVTIPVQLERTGEVTGEPKLAVTYQACTDRVCLRPETEILPVPVRQGDGE